MRSALGEPPVAGRAARPGRPDPASGQSTGASRRARRSEGIQARLTDPGRLLALGAAVGLATMAATSSGDALVAGVLLGLAAADVVSGATGILAALAVAGRWGSTSLVALAGGQAVVGAAGWSGPPAMVASSWAAALAVLLACPRGDRPLDRAGALAAGVFAAALVAGPAVGLNTASVVALRLGASLVGVAAAFVVIRVVPHRPARILGLIAAASAAAIALLA